MAVDVADAARGNVSNCFSRVISLLEEEEEEKKHTHSTQ